MAPLQRDESGDLGRAPRPREGRDREARGWNHGLRPDGSRRHRQEPAAGLRSEVKSEVNFSPNFEELVLGCIDADFCK